MNRNIRFLWIVAAIVILAGCKKENNPQSPIDGHANMLIMKDLITIVPGSPNNPDVFLDVDQDGVNDFAIEAKRFTSHGGLSGYHFFTLTTVNPNVELFGYIDQDTIWRSCNRDTIQYPDYVLFGEANYYNCHRTSPAQTIHEIKPNVLKPYLYLSGDNFNPMQNTYNGKVNLYRSLYVFGSYSGPINGSAWATSHTHANNCFNLPINTDIRLRFVKHGSGNKQNTGWIRLQIILQGGSKLEIIETAITLY